MLDPPNVDDNIRRLPNGSCHLYRLCQSNASESKCEYVLLLPLTRLGQSQIDNDVVLNCSNNLSNLRDRHAIIRAVVDKLHGNILHYELIAQEDASIFVNCCQIQELKPRQLHPGDCILFGNKAKVSDGFMFRFEPANEMNDYPVMRHNLLAESASEKQCLILSSNSLNYKVANPHREETPNDANLVNAPPLSVRHQMPLVSELIYGLLSSSPVNYAPILQDFSSKENVLDYPIRSASSVNASTTVLELCPELRETTINIEEIKLRADKFDVDIYEVVKRIASRIASNHEREREIDLSEDSTANNNNNDKKTAENSNVELPMITSATDFNVYSPACSLEFRHTPSTSSSLFNNSDTSGYLTNDSSANFTENGLNLRRDEEEEEKKSVKDEKTSSPTNLQLLAALASNNYEESKPLAIFIPLSTCSDGENSLSPTQTIKSERHPSSGRGFKPRSSRQSTHEGDDAHPHTIKQLKMKAGIDACRRRMLKYIANNMYTSRIVQHYRDTETSKIGMTSDIYSHEIRSLANKNTKESSNNGPPKPLNLYPDGEEYVTKDIDSNKIAIVETITEADQRLYATLLLQIRQSQASSIVDSDSCSEHNFHESDTSVIEPKDEKNTERTKQSINLKPSIDEQRLFQRAEQMLPRIDGVGRHTVAKYRLLYRSQLDRTSSETIATQRHRLLKKCREDRLKDEEKIKVQQKKLIAGRRKSNTKRSDQLPSPTSRNTLKSPVARLPVIKKSSRGSGYASGGKRQSTDFSTLSIHQLAKDPNFEGFLGDECKKSSDPYRFDEDEDPFSGKKASPIMPFFATENARPAAISANAAIHTHQQASRRPRKRQQSGNPDKSSGKNLVKEESDTPKGKRGRQPNARKAKKARVEKEEPCAFEDCSPQHLQLVSAKSAIEWVACDRCDTWFHCICALGLNRPVGQQEKFQCRRCQTD